MTSTATLIEALRDGATPSFAQFLEVLGADFSLLHELEATPQDPTWHGEGDVRIHTEMVLAEVYKAIDKSPESFDATDRVALILGTLFHDIAKPLTTRTREIEGIERIVAPRHPARGRSYLTYLLPKLPLTFEEQRQIMQLVGQHHEPKMLIIKERSEAAFRAVASQVNPRLLTQLCLADMRGRICPDLDQQIETIEMFRLFCQEYNLRADSHGYEHWVTEILAQLEGEDPDLIEYTFVQGIRDHTHGAIYTPAEAVARSYRQREGMSRVVLLCGPSGSGKSTWAREAFSDYEVISLDQIRAELGRTQSDQSNNTKVSYLATDRLRECLRRKRNVIWDATNTRRDFRRQLASLSHDYGAHVTLALFQMPQEDLFARNDKRDYPIPRHILERQISQLEWPEETEAHRQLTIDQHGTILHDSRSRWGLPAAQETPS